MSVKWIWLLLLLPALAWGSEHCADQMKGVCREICGPSEVAEQGAFIDCREGQKCCVESSSDKDRAHPAKVFISNYSFSPAEIRIKRGTEVIWRNGDGIDHTVTAAEGSFDSGTLGLDAEYKKRFDKPGTYPYSCEMHPSMTGSVVVE